MAHPGPRSIPRELIRPLLNRPGTPRANRGGSAYRPRSAVVKMGCPPSMPARRELQACGCPDSASWGRSRPRRTCRPQCAIGAARHRLENEQSTCRASNREARRTGPAPRTRRATPSDEPPPGGGHTIPWQRGDQSHCGAVLQGPAAIAPRVGPSSDTWGARDLSDPGVPLVGFGVGGPADRAFSRNPHHHHRSGYNPPRTREERARPRRSTSTRETNGFRTTTESPLPPSCRRPRYIRR